MSKPLLVEGKIPESALATVLGVAGRKPTEEQEAFLAYILGHATAYWEDKGIGGGASTGWCMAALALVHFARDDETRLLIIRERWVQREKKRRKAQERWRDVLNR